MSSKEKVRYYREFSDDFEVTQEQDLKLPEDYKFIRKDTRSRFLSGLIYTLAIIFGSPFCRFYLHTRYRNRKAFRAVKDESAFIYGNHTQPVGDVFLPALACLPRRIYTVVSPANLGIPVLGKILPYLGALPLPDTLSGMKNFTAALEQRIDEKKIVTIYPEAHVWEYHTQIRPYSDASFKYPVKLNKPVFAMTVTYQKRFIGRKPRTTVYVDGPFYPDRTLSPRQQAADLRDRVYQQMQSRSRHSNCDYIRYEKIIESEE